MFQCDKRNYVRHAEVVIINIFNLVQWPFHKNKIYKANRLIRSDSLKLIGSDIKSMQKHTFTTERFLQDIPNLRKLAESLWNKVNREKLLGKENELC